MASGPTITAKFVADTSELSGVGKTVAGAFSVNQIADTARNVADVTSKVVEFGASIVNAGSDLNESMSKTGVVFGGSADSIVAWSKDAATSMGLSQQAALEAAGTYGNLAVALGLPEDKAADMSKSLVGLAGDMASFNNVPVDDALNALRSGLTGETEPLKVFGINMNDAALKAEALKLGLVSASVDQAKLSKTQETAEKATRKQADALAKHGAASVQYSDATRDVEQANAALAEVMAGKVPASLDASTKAQAAYGLIMEQSTTAQGDFARTSGGLANQEKIATAQIEDLKAKLGTALLPILTQIASFLTTSVLPAFESTFGWIGDHKEVVIAAVIGIGAVLLPMFVSWAISAGAAAVATLIALAPLILIGLAVAALAYIVITNWDTIKAATQAAWDKVLSIIQSVWNWITNTWSSVYDSIVGPVQSAIDFIIGLWQSITGIAQGVIDWFSNTWSSIYDSIVGPIQSAIDFVTGLFDKIGGVVSGIVDAVTPGSVSVTAGAAQLGATIGVVADVPQLADGGLLTSSGLVYAHRGEVIAPIEKVRRGGPVLHIEHAQFNDPVDVDLLAKHIEFALSSGLSV